MNVVILGAGAVDIGTREALLDLGIVLREVIEIENQSPDLLKAEEPVLEEENPPYDLRPRRVKIKKLPAVKAAAFNRKTVRATSPVRRNKTGGRRK